MLTDEVTFLDYRAWPHNATNQCYIGPAIFHNFQVSEKMIHHAIIMYSGADNSKKSLITDFNDSKFLTTLSTEWFLQEICGFYSHSYFSGSLWVMLERVLLIVSSSDNKYCEDAVRVIWYFLFLSQLICLLSVRNRD